jgi:hypothetical protein
MINRVEIKSDFEPEIYPHELRNTTQNLTTVDLGNCISTGVSQKYKTEMLTTRQTLEVQLMKLTIKL